MSSVTKRIGEIKQPRGGYIKPGMMHKTVLDDGETPHMDGNVNASIAGTAVDYLARFMRGSDIKDAFRICLAGAERAEMMGLAGARDKAHEYLANIGGLDC